MRKLTSIFAGTGLLILFLLCLAPVGQAQSCVQLAQGATPPYVLGLKCNFNASSVPFGAFSTAGITYWQVVFVPSGTVSAASLSLDSSLSGLGGSWTTGGVLSSATIGSMTSSGSYGPNSTPTTPSNYGQLTPSITGSGSVSVVLYGYTTSPGGGSGLPTNCNGTIGSIACTGTISAALFVAAGFQTTAPNGGLTLTMGNGSGTGASVGNGVIYANNVPANPCLEFVVGGGNGSAAAVDEGCGLSAMVAIPAIDRSVGMTTAAMAAQSSATLTPITNMLWTLAASKNYLGWCEIPVTFVASATISFGLVGPGTPTSYGIDAYGLIGAAAVYGDISLTGQTTWVSTKTAASGAPGAVTEIVHVNFQIQNGTTAGNLSLDTAGNGTNNFTVGANAVCHVIQQN